MAEGLAIAASITSILKGIATTSSLLRDIHGAPEQAKQVAAQIEATKAILTALKTSVSTQRRSQEFHTVWNASARTVFKNIWGTIVKLNERLGGSGTRVPATIRLGLWRRVKWPLGREEGLHLLIELHGYMQMLSLVQNGFMQ
jgi:hypothetical protein